MIKILQKQFCCGCAACVQRCPKHCISLQEDNEGFLYPHVDESVCIDCGWCEKVCPVIHQQESAKPIIVYAAKNVQDDIRMNSSSGGIFTALAEKVIAEGGVVFGVRFDKHWEVVTDYTETKEGLSLFRESKYLQSRIGDSFTQAESFLKSGRKVLFSGTPCQIAGLKLFLKKEYDNLVAIDIICHGVPSPGIWRQYLKEETARMCGQKNTVLPHSIPERDVHVEGISFRNKDLGWKKFSFALILSTTNGSGEKFSFCSHMPFKENPFMKGFLSDLYLRPSCYACPAKCGRSGSDLTLGDFWGVQLVMPELDDDKGVSVVLVNSEKGNRYCKGLEIHKWGTTYDQVLQYNPAIEKSVQIPRNRKKFYASTSSVIKRIEICTRRPWKERMKSRMIRIASSMLSKRGKEFIKKYLLNKE